MIKQPLLKTENISTLGQEIDEKYKHFNAFIMEKNLYDGKHVLSLI